MKTNHQRGYRDDRGDSRYSMRDYRDRMGRGSRLYRSKTLRNFEVSDRRAESNHFDQE